jgi:hypothetical protein
MWPGRRRWQRSGTAIRHSRRKYRLAKRGALSLQLTASLPNSLLAASRPRFSWELAQ